MKLSSLFPDDKSSNLLDIFKALSKKPISKNQGRLANPNLAASSDKNSELDVDGVPNIDYQGTDVSAPLDSEASPVVDLKQQMKDPDSAGGQGLQNLGQPLDKMKNWEYPIAPLGGNSADYVSENHVSPMVDFRKQLTQPQTPGSQAIPLWALPGEQYAEDDDNFATMPISELAVLAKSNNKAAQALKKRRSIKNESKIKRDPYITEIYEAI